MKLKATIISIVSVLVVGLTAILLYCFWPAIKGTVDNSKYYTQEELQESYDKGYDDGCKTEDELTGQVKYYKSLVDEYYIQVNTLNDEITMLTKNKKDYETQITSLETQKTNLQSQVDNLTTIKTNNETTIASLNSQITSLQNQVTNLTNSCEDKREQIKTLNSQITTLQNIVSQLQTTNDMNVATIKSLNTQIANLNTQISDMTLQSQNSQGQINALNNKITELQKSVTYYESYIASLENGEQVVATFEFDGSVYNIQIVNKGSKLAVTNPTSTNYKIFNGWTVNGETIDLNTYTINANTKIVADVTYKYDVKFMVDEITYNSQIITKNGNATLPTNPSKYGYEFDGWSLNGVDVITDIASKQITENTTYISVFTKLHTVTFMYENNSISTQVIRNGDFASAVSAESTDYKIFNGWSVNDTIVDLNTYKIVTDTLFVANITYKYDVTFMVDEAIFNSQLVVKNSFCSQPVNPIKESYNFKGWAFSLDGELIDVTNIEITENTIFYAIFVQVFRVNIAETLFSTPLYATTREKGQIIGSLEYNPTKENSVFDHYELAVFVGTPEVVDLNTYVVNSDITLTPVFKITHRVVKFFDEDGVTLLSSYLLPIEERLSAIPTVPVKEGYRHVGWVFLDFEDYSPQYYTDDDLRTNSFSFGLSFKAVYEYYSVGTFTADDGGKVTFYQKKDGTFYFYQTVSSMTFTANSDYTKFTYTSSNGNTQYILEYDKSSDTFIFKSGYKLSSGWNWGSKVLNRTHHCVFGYMIEVKE